MQSLQFRDLKCNWSILGDIFLHQSFSLFTPKFLLFLQQFFTQKILLFYTKFGNLENDFLKKIGGKNVVEKKWWKKCDGKNVV